MKKNLLLTASVLALSCGSAMADCPSGHVPAPGGAVSIPSISFETNAFSIGSGVPQKWFDSGPQTDAKCFTAGALSIGGAPAVTGAWHVVDPKKTPDDPTDDWSVYHPPVTAVIGQNSTAIGNKAFVGRVETYVDDKGTPDTADDTEEKRLVPVNNGTALGANTQVLHNHSTAIGADTQTSNDHQIAIGTGNDTIRARGITSGLSKSRQEGPVEVVTSDSGGRLATDGGAIFDTLGEHSETLDIHTAVLSRHSAQIDKLGKGVAVAMSMPDAYLESDKNFAIAAGFGGFDGDLGFGAVGTVRIDKTWSLYGGVGLSLDGGEVGFKGGGRASW
ncbi:MAG TPA: hypothetical protein VFO41_08860 [Alphaproteobacteria bacterium]|nr:hypothetical protein [Alphaproteobacteria bacterium]